MSSKVSLKEILGAPMSAYEIAECFNTASTRVHWRAVLNSNGKPSVVFADKHSGIIRLIYVPQDDVWLVQFKQVVASFANYANAIAKAYVSVLQALQAGGAPFQAPETLEQVEIVIRHGGLGNVVEVRNAKEPITEFLVDMPETAIIEDTGIDEAESA